MERALSQAGAHCATMLRLAEPRPSWQGLLVDSVSDLMHYQYRLSLVPRPSAQEEAGGSRTATARRSFQQPVVASMLSSSKRRGDHEPQCLGPLHHVHRRQRPRHPAQQGHVRTQRRGLPHRRSVLKQRHMEKGRSCFMWPPTTPICCRLSHGHVLLSPHSHQGCQKNVTIDLSLAASSWAHGPPCRVHRWRHQHDRLLHCG